MNLYCARVLERKHIGEHVLLRYRWDGPESEPGQFVGVRAAGSLEPFLPRPFFVHDRGEGEISLFFKVVGRGTAALAEGGGEILVSEPCGRGFDLNLTGRAALVGGGVWVAPLKFLSRRLREARVAHDVYLEAPADAPDEYLCWLGEAYPGAELIRTDGSSGEVVGSIAGLGDYERVYVSGNPETLSAAASYERAQLAVRERMACMDGSCYGCAVPVRSGDGVSYRRVCVEGPVFAAGDLAW